MNKNTLAAVIAAALVSCAATYSVCGGMKSGLIDAQSLYNADVNNDGKVNVLDMNIVKKIVLDTDSNEPEVSAGPEVTDIPAVTEKSPENKNPADDGVLTILCWNENDSRPMVDFFCKTTGTDISSVKIMNFDTYGGDAENAYRKYLSDPDNDADIIFYEPDWGYQFINDDNQTLPLSALGYSETDFTSLYPYIVETGKSTVTGKLKGISWQAAPGCFCYRTDLADKYLGVKSPEEMQYKVRDWKSFLETAETLRSHDISVSATLGGVMKAYSQSKFCSWLDPDNRLFIDDFCISGAELANELWNRGYVTKVHQWSDEWRPLGQTDDVLGYFVPVWGFDDVLLTGAAGGENGITFGKWNACIGPSEYYWGGTWLAPAARMNSSTLAKQFIDFFTTDEKNALAYAEHKGEFMANINVMKTVIKKGEYKGAPVLGGQNQFEVLDNVASAIDVKGKITPYDSVIDNAYMDAVYGYCDGTFADTEDTMQYFRDSVNSQLQDVIRTD